MRNESAVEVAGEPIDVTPTPEEAHNERAIAIVRLVASIVTIVNIVAGEFGWEPLGIDYQLLYTLISGGIAIGASLWSWWKNNNMTHAAQAGQKVTDAIKAQHLKEV